MATKRSVIGDRYRNLHVAAWNDEWIVEAIYTGTDAHEYAYLRSASDQTQYKTLALSVVSDPTRFVLVSTP
jgi:hypothetical protein